MSARAVGVTGVGLHLPPVRTNDWWPAEVVARWAKESAAELDRAQDAEGEVFSEGARVILEAMAPYRGDPFRGVTERRVLPDGVPSSVMELAAAKDALERAQVPASRIGLVLTWSAIPDDLLVPQACRVHHELGLPRGTMAVALDGAQNSFHHQLALARPLIASGAIDYALLVQSCAWTRWFGVETPASGWIGDGATAVVLGPVAPEHGVLAQRDVTDGSYTEGLVFGVPGQRWYDEGRVRAYFRDSGLARRVITETVAASAAVAQDAMKAAGVAEDQVDFYAAYQGFAWLRAATQRLIGLKNPATVDTFSWSGNIGAVNIPLVWAMGEREGLLKPGQTVVSVSGGSGVTISSSVLRWGTGGPSGF